MWKTRLERQLGKFVGVRNTTETKNNPALRENSYDVHQEEMLLIFWTIFLCTTFQKRLISREVQYPDKLMFTVTYLTNK